MRAERRARLAVSTLAVLAAVAAGGCGPDGVEPATGTTPAPTTSTTVPVGEFHVDGDDIVGPDGEPFVARGVNLLGPQSFWPDETAGLSRAVRSWGLNTVRINTCLPGGCQDADGASWDVNDDLDAIVDEFTGAGLVVIVALHQVEPGTFPDDAAFAAVSAFWQETAARYADNPLVWFNLLNEPGQGTVDVRWRTVHERLVDVVREQAPNLILIDGTQYGQEAGLPPGTGTVTDETSAILRHGPALAARAPDIAFSVHVYDQWGEPADDLARFERLRDFVADVREQDLALLIGETGAPADEPDGDRARATRTAYEVAAALDVGLLAWHGQAGDDFDLLTRRDGTRADLDELGTAEPTWQGELLLDLADPQTDPEEG